MSTSWCRDRDQGNGIESWEVLLAAIGVACLLETDSCESAERDAAAAQVLLLARGEAARLTLERRLTDSAAAVLGVLESAGMILNLGAD